MPSGKRLLLTAVVAALVATAAIAIAILLFGDFSDVESRILGTTGFIAIAGLLSLPGAVLLDQSRLAPLAWATISLAAAALVISITALWSELDTAWTLTGSLAAVALAATQTSGLASRLREGDTPWLRRLFAAATALVGAVAAMVVYLMWADVDGEAFPRVLAALAVADVLAVVLQPVLRRGSAPPALHRLRLTLGDGATVEVDGSGSDFADAVARAIRRVERDGKQVRAAERMPS